MIGGIFRKAWNVYFKHYKTLLFIPFILALLSIGQIVYQIHTTGDFISKDISLKGGVTLTVIDSTLADVKEIESLLLPEFAPSKVSVRALKGTSGQIGFLIESDISSLNKEKVDSILGILGKKLGKEITRENYSLETLGSSLGNSFYTQTVNAMIIAFIFMAIVVFLYYRTFAPSIAVIVCAFSDIVTTIAVVNLFGIQVGTAGIAAFLMLIGYSVDTDMLLTARLLYRKTESPQDAIFGAFKTGMMMTLTTLAALIIGLIFTQADVIRQIMTIILIGLLIDIFNTWVQNAGILLWYVEKKSKNDK